MGVADGNGSGPVVRNRIGLSGVVGAARMLRDGIGIPLGGVLLIADARGDRAVASTAHAGSVGRLHDWGAGCLHHSRGRDVGRDWPRSSPSGMVSKRPMDSLIVEAGIREWRCRSLRRRRAG